MTSRFTFRFMICFGISFSIQWKVFKKGDFWLQISNSISTICWKGYFSSIYQLCLLSKLSRICVYFLLLYSVAWSVHSWTDFLKTNPRGLFFPIHNLFETGGFGCARKRIVSRGSKTLVVKMTTRNLYAWMDWCMHRFYGYYRRRQKVLSIKRNSQVTNIKLLKILNISRLRTSCQFQNDAKNFKIFKWIFYRNHNWK